MKRYAVRVILRTGINGAILWHGTVRVNAKNQASAYGAAREYVQENVVECDPRLAPMIDICEAREEEPKP